MVTQKVWDTLMDVLEDVHGRPGTLLKRSVVFDLMERTAYIEQLYIDERDMPGIVGREE